MQYPQMQEQFRQGMRYDVTGQWGEVLSGIDPQTLISWDVTDEEVFAYTRGLQAATICATRSSARLQDMACSLCCISARSTEHVLCIDPYSTVMLLGLGGAPLALLALMVDFNSTL